MTIVHVLCCFRFCSMNTWDPSRNTCAAPEEVLPDAAPVSADVDATLVPAAAPAPVLERPRKQARTDNKDESSWVQCDAPKCRKWRVVPHYINTSLFPIKWCARLGTLAVSCCFSSPFAFGCSRCGGTVRVRVHMLSSPTYSLHCCREVAWLCCVR